MAPARHAKQPVAARFTAGIGLAMAVVVAVGHQSTSPSIAPSAVTQETTLAPDALPAPLVQSLSGAVLAATFDRLGVPTPTGPAAAPLAVLPSLHGAGRALSSTVLAAYLAGQQREAQRSPGCHLPWSLLAGIGMIESGHGWGHGAERAGWDGVARPPILGPALDGNGYAAIPDSEGGVLDGSAAWDRAVGPMQFLPSTWRRWGVDANGDGRADPQQLGDAAAAAADYLCAGGRDVGQPGGLVAAVYSYNHSMEYVRSVLSAASGYGAVDSVVISAALAALPPVAVPASAVRPAPAGTSRPIGTPRPTRSPGRPSAVPTSTGPTSTGPTSTGSPAAGPSTSGSPPAASPSPTAEPSASGGPGTRSPAPAPTDPDDEADTAYRHGGVSSS